MTEQEVIQLSNEVAVLYGITEYYIREEREYLVDDWQRLMPLVIENDLTIDCYVNTTCASFICEDTFPRYYEHYKDHPTKERAVAVAILKALKAKKEN